MSELPLKDIMTPKDGDQEQELLYETQNQNIVSATTGIARGVYRWQLWVKSIVIALFFILLCIDFYCAHAILHFILYPPASLSAESASLLKVFLGGQFASMVGLVSGIVALIGIWPIRKDNKVTE